MAGQILELDITGVAHGGIFVARHEGRVIFVSDAIDGERVRAVVTDDSKPGFWRATTVEVLEASEHRVPHVWPEADVEADASARPGGAEFGHIDLAYQRELKARVIAESLARFAKLEREVTVEPVAGETDGLRWRTRARIHADESGRIGPFAERTHTVVPVRSFPLFTPALEQTALALTEDTVVGSIRGYDLVDTGEGVLVLPVKQAPRRGAKRAPERPAQSVTQRVGERTFRLDANGFWQVHHGAAATLTQAVRDAVGSLDVWPASGAHHLDLYGGVGLLAAALADALGPDIHVTSVEADARATEYAATNLHALPNASAETGRVDRWLAALDERLNSDDRAHAIDGIVVLDPPRSGAGKDVVASIARLSPHAVVYVACDPVALARDIASFAELGYQLGSIRAYDLFPHTHHVETVAVLQR